MKITNRSLLFISKVKADCQRYVGGAQGSFLKINLTNSDGEEETLTLYKTGDFAKIVDGRLYYEGRLDAQVREALISKKCSFFEHCSKGL